MLAGGCAGRTTVRAAEGNLGAWVVLLAFALTAAATYFGALEPYRVWLVQNGAASITIAGPLARATVFLTTGSLPGYGFTISVLMGIVAGALASALLTRSFHLIIPEAQHLKHLLARGALMGIGSICAGGCNIGVGLTGMSTGSIRALTALVAIVAGMLLGIALLTRTEKIAERDYHHHPTTHGVGA